MGDLEGHCAGECDCYPAPGIVLKIRREVNRKFDRSMIGLNDCFAETIGDYFSSFTIRARTRLAAAFVEDNFPRVYNLLVKLGVPRPYS